MLENFDASRDVSSGFSEDQIDFSALASITRSNISITEDSNGNSVLTINDGASSPSTLFEITLDGLDNVSLGDGATAEADILQAMIEDQLLILNQP